MGDLLIKFLNKYRNAIGARLPNAVQRVLFNSPVIMLLSGNRWFGLGGLDKIIVQEFAKGHRGFFVELGANNGVAQSNTKHLELFKGWSGVLIEPWFDNYLRIAVTRSKRTKAINAGCVSPEYDGKTLKLHFADLMTVAEGIKTETGKPELWALEGARFVEKNLRGIVFEAPARTLSSILEEVGAPTFIDFLSLDVEGAEMEVLRGLDLRKFKVGLMCIETRSLDSVVRHLEKFGYTLKAQVSAHDYFFEQS